MVPRTQRVLGAALAATVLVCLVVFDPSGADLERYHLPKEACLALLAALCALGMLWRRRAAQVDALDVALAALVLTDLAASFDASDADVALRGLTLTAALSALAWVVRGMEVRDVARLRFAALLALSVSACGIILESHGLLRLSLPGFAPGGGLGSRNNAGHLLALALSAWAALALGAEQRALGMASLLALVPTGWALVLTRSRAAWLGALLGLVVVLAGALARRQLRLSRVAALGVVLALAAYGPVFLRPRLAWRSHDPYRDSLVSLLDASGGSGRGRIEQWRTSLALVSAHPWLGVGPGHWAYAYPHVASAADRTLFRDSFTPTARLGPSDLLMWLVERGVLGASLLVLVLVAIGRGNVGAMLRAEPGAQAALGAFAALLVPCALDVVLRVPLGALSVALLAPARLGGTPAQWKRMSQALTVVALLALVPRALQRAHLSHAAASATAQEMAALAGQAPWNTELRLRLVAWWLSRGDCARAVPELRRIAARRPGIPRVETSLRECGGHAEQ